ncbi:MAG: dTDP-4-dehydrorhamnose reductase [Treponema sp.]|nr:dTDP-4-dehydrorhamnose reductase [Treponema sp.]
MIWITGNKGMLGTELSLCLKRRGLAFAGTDRELDIADPAALAEFAAGFSDAGPLGGPLKWIINCAAYTAVDRAEDDTENCRRLNTQGAAYLARCAQNSGAGFIHFSTDYVFDGAGIHDGDTGTLRPYRADDPTEPLNVYGLTKRDGETAVMKNNSRSYIIRTAWLYGKYGNNFVHNMLRLMKEKDTLVISADQRGSPTWALDLAEMTIALIGAVNSGKKIPCGIYHYTNEGDTTWFNFAGAIYNNAREFGLLPGPVSINPCGSKDYPTKAARPAYSVLDKGKIKAALGIQIPQWDESLRAFLRMKADEQDP